MTCIIIGSGPSGIHAALTLLRRGRAVELWDVGRREAPFPRPEANFDELRELLEDPQSYFLGERFEALLAPSSGELLRYPPSRAFLVERDDPRWPFVGTDFRPYVSFSRGGLGLGWGVNALSFDDDDLKNWPISFSDLAAAYEESCRRIPIAGVVDGLSPFYPGVSVSQPPVHLNRHDAQLLKRSTRSGALVERCWGVTIGRARLAVTTSPAEPGACRLCGRCLWGCPHGSLYSPVSTLDACERFEGFSYKAGRLVIALVSRDDRITGIRYLDTSTGREHLESIEGAVFLGAGALQSGAVFLRSLKLARELDMTGGAQARTQSVMDTKVVKIPYLQLRSVGSGIEGVNFQFNRLLIAHRVKREGDWPVHCHGEVLSLTTLLYHSLTETIPLGSRLATKVFAQLRPALGVVTLFFPDRQLPGNGIELIPDSDSPTNDRLRIHYREGEDKEALMRQTVRDIRRALLMLGCVPSTPVEVAAGGGIHYAGTVPMGRGVRCCSRSGRSNAYLNLYLCDGAAFPSLPSKSITLSLVANAIRVATLANV